MGKAKPLPPKPALGGVRLFAEFTLNGVRLFPFTEPVLSEILRSLRSLRMTGSEGFRVRMTTSKGFRASAHSLRMTAR